MEDFHQTPLSAHVGVTKIPAEEGGALAQPHQGGFWSQWLLSLPFLFPGKELSQPKPLLQIH